MDFHYQGWQNLFIFIKIHGKHVYNEEKCNRFFFQSRMRDILFLVFFLHHHPISPLEAQIPTLAQITALKFKFRPRGSNPCQKAQIAALRVKSEPQGPNTSLDAQISALRPKSEPQGPNPNLKKPNPSLKVQTLAIRPKSQPQIQNQAWLCRPQLLLCKPHCSLKALTP